MTTRAQIDEFWSLKRLAIAGVSHNPQDFSRTVMSELQKRGYQVYPVNPNLKDVDGKPCYAQVQDIQPAVDGVIILTQPDATEQIVVDCAAAGVPRVLDAPGWRARRGQPECNQVLPGSWGAGHCRLLPIHVPARHTILPSLSCLDTQAIRPVSELSPTRNSECTGFSQRAWQ